MAPPLGAHNNPNSNHENRIVLSPAATTTSGIGGGRKKRIPVTILTGLPSAGKTTLRNHLLRDDETHRFVVIHNELVDEEIEDPYLSDRSAAAESTEDTRIEAGNGSVCCTIRGDSIGELERLHGRLGPAATPEGQSSFDAVIIETSGLTDDLAPLLQTFFTKESIAEKYSLDAVLTVVDAEQILTLLDKERFADDDMTSKAVQQILFADKIILNKVDLVSNAKVAAVEERLHQLHPTASLIHCQHGRVPPTDLLGLNSFDLDRISTMLPNVLRDDGESLELNDTAVSSMTCVLQGELHIELLSDWIEKVIKGLKNQLYRYKGVFAVKGRDEKYIFQGVGMVWSGDYSKTKRWNHEKRISRLVFTGHNLDALSIQKGLQACLVKDLRFAVGESIQANIGRWINGEIIRHWDEGNAYRIRLKPDGREVWARFDIDGLVRKKTKTPYDGGGRNNNKQKRPTNKHKHGTTRAR